MNQIWRKRERRTMRDIRTGVFYPDKDTKRLRYYSQFFNTAEMDYTFTHFHDEGLHKDIKAAVASLESIQVKESMTLHKQVAGIRDTIYYNVIK